MNKYLSDVIIYFDTSSGIWNSRREKYCDNEHNDMYVTFFLVSKIVNKIVKNIVLFKFAYGSCVTLLICLKIFVFQRYTMTFCNIFSYLYFML